MTQSKNPKIPKRNGIISLSFEHYNQQVNEDYDSEINISACFYPDYALKWKYRMQCSSANLSMANG